MANEAQPAPAMLVIGVLCGADEFLGPARERCEALFGPLRSDTGAINFDFTSYYAKEMGEGVSRSFWSFSEPFPRGCLADAKIATSRLERAFAVNGQRTVNLDPGILSLESLVLATTKPYSHRVYLSRGIYAEVTLMFSRSGLETMPWTYPDYREGWVHEFLLGERDFLKGWMNEERRIESRV